MLSARLFASICIVSLCLRGNTALPYVRLLKSKCIAQKSSDACCWNTYKRYFQEYTSWNRIGNPPVTSVNAQISHGPRRAVCQFACLELDAMQRSVNVNEPRNIEIQFGFRLACPMNHLLTLDTDPLRPVIDTLTQSGKSITPDKCACTPMFSKSHSPYAWRPVDQTTSSTRSDSMGTPGSKAGTSSSFDPVEEYLLSDEEHEPDPFTEEVRLFMTITVSPEHSL